MGGVKLATTQRFTLISKGYMIVVGLYAVVLVDVN